MEQDERKQPWWAAEPVVFGFLIVVGLILLAPLDAIFKINALSEPADATVVGVTHVAHAHETEPEDEDEPPTAYETYTERPQFAFTDKDGEEHVGESIYDGYEEGTWSVGDEVEIKYDPDHPDGHCVVAAHAYLIRQGYVQRIGAGLLMPTVLFIVWGSIVKLNKKYTQPKQVARPDETSPESPQTPDDVETDEPSKEGEEADEDYVPDAPTASMSDATSPRDEGMQPQSSDGPLTANPAYGNTSTGSTGRKRRLGESIYAGTFAVFFVFILGFMLFTFASSAVETTRHVSSLSEQATAVVSDVGVYAVHTKKSSTRYYERPTFTFTDSNGVEHAATSIYDDYPVGSWYVGDEAEIRYDSSDPDGGCLASTEASPSRWVPWAFRPLAYLALLMLLPLLKWRSKVARDGDIPPTSEEPLSLEEEDTGVAIPEATEMETEDELPTVPVSPDVIPDEGAYLPEDDTEVGRQDEPADTGLDMRYGAGYGFGFGADDLGGAD